MLKYVKKTLYNYLHLNYITANVLLLQFVLLLFMYFVLSNT